MELKSFGSLCNEGDYIILNDERNLQASHTMTYLGKKLFSPRIIKR
jgi:hypothetical protein